MNQSWIHTLVQPYSIHVRNKKIEKGHTRPQGHSYGQPTPHERLRGNEFSIISGPLVTDFAILAIFLSVSERGIEAVATEIDRVAWAKIRQTVSTLIRTRIDGQPPHHQHLDENLRVKYSYRHKPIDTDGKFMLFDGIYELLAILSWANRFFAVPFLRPNERAVVSACVSELIKEFSCLAVECDDVDEEEL